MIELLIVSDTHQNVDILKDVINTNPECDYIIHLGDDYEDMDNVDISLVDKKVVKVPGIFHPKYKDGSLDKTKIIELGNKRILLVHARKDIEKPQDINLFGHTHNWEISNSKSGIFFNPGHLRCPTEKHRKASYGLITINNGIVNYKIIDFTHKLLVEAKF